MKIVLPLLIMLFVVANVHALKPQSSQTEEVPAREAVAGPDRKSEKPVSKPAVEPSSTFTPSEKVQADSAVSFPVDI